MFRDNHRADLKEAHAAEVKAMRDTLIIQADLIDWLRSKLDGHAYVSQRTPAVNPTQQPTADPATGSKKWLSEEEEEILALNLNGHISDLELSRLQDELGLSHLMAVPALPDDD